MGYATREQLATYLGITAPADADRLLSRASELVDDHIVTATYDIDANDQPTHPGVITALQDATCAQVEYWLAGDEEDDVLGPLQGVSMGGQQQQYGAGTNRATPMYLAPRAARHLRRAGLLSGSVRGPGAGWWL